MKNTLSTLLFFSCIVSVRSQISITATQMPVSGDTLRFSNARAASVGNYTVTGANYNWDFSTLIPTGQGIRSFKSGLNTPYFILFGATAYGELTQDTVPIPTIPIPGVPSIRITDIYNFYSKSPIILPTKFLAEGLGLKINGVPVPNTFSNEDELYFFPLNYLDRDSSTFRFSTISNTLIPFRYIKQGYRITQADGWGTITTPFGTANCLRVVTTQYSIDTIKGTLPILNTPFSFGFPNYERKYQWLTLGQRIPYFEIVGTLIGANYAPTQYRYRDVARNIVGIKEENSIIALSVFPNPTTNYFTIVTPQNNQPIKATLTNLQGQIVLSQQFLNNNEIVNQHQLNVSELSKGIYILTLSTDSQKQNLKITVQ